MKLLEKIELLLNTLLLKLAEFCWKLIPESIKRKMAIVRTGLRKILNAVKALPPVIKLKLIALVNVLKSYAGSFNFKAALQETYKKALAQSQEKSPSQKSGKLKTLFMAPFLIIGQWLNGLNAAQSMLLLTFSAGSFLAMIGIFFSGQRLVTGMNEAGRFPASTEDEVAYERPAYYKKQTKFFTITSLRLPVYVAKVNEIRSVDLDFTATVTNRYSRIFLEKNEFQLRDHLILQLEPSVASFPLKEEGKVIIREKLLSEINDFLRLNEIEGEVTEIKITYVLAN